MFIAPCNHCASIQNTYLFHSVIHNLTKNINKLLKNDAFLVNMD